ncbi:PREDICTED: uncharacterized protein LOC104603556 [Nelumbo nucifera]|uniref:Uncharacterized protein LOC104603556 n=1 Tax=Nelumbo nucifera TaxID=4432 RepID=A0A1U8ASW4_NELNU|nr:PREDICTED: uncharacterized protein LOC104603556 [Nelumbo nucifera]
MNTAMKTALNSFQANSNYIRAALFHSTPILDRKRRSHWDSGGRGAFRGSSKRFNYYSKKCRRMDAKETLLRNVSAYADYLFQSWQSDDENISSSSKEGSWFRRRYWTKGRKTSSFHQGSQYRGRRKGVFEFCFGDEEEVETIFQSAFGGGRYFYWSFINEEDSRWRNSSYYSNKYQGSQNWKYWSGDEYEASTEHDTSQSNLTSERLALGLSASGSLKLEEVKNAYRVCALKWHPDRHQGSSKAVAEEKFKLCSAAYQSLCDKLAVG